MSRKSSVDGLPCDTISHHVIPTERAGALSVWVQGDLSLAQKVIVLRFFFENNSFDN